MLQISMCYFFNAIGGFTLMGEVTVDDRINFLCDVTCRLQGFDSSKLSRQFLFYREFYSSKLN